MSYHKDEFYTRKAREDGYFARSVYKLEEIDRKFHILKQNQKIVDLGCAPGSWSQYISKKVGPKGLVVGIDYKETRFSSPNMILVKGRFTTLDNKDKISSHGPFDGVVSDMAPDTSGDRLTDCYKSSDLVTEALHFACDFLKEGGFFIAKIFQGGDEKELMKLLEKSFASCHWFKPKSTRKKSFEIFMIGTGFMGKQEEDDNNEGIDLSSYEESGQMPW